MNGLVLCAGANKTVGSLEFSKMRLQPVVKHRKTEQLLLELSRSMRPLGERGGGLLEKTATLLVSDAVPTLECKIRKYFSFVSGKEYQTPWQINWHAENVIG